MTVLLDLPAIPTCSRPCPAHHLCPVFLRQPQLSSNTLHSPGPTLNPTVSGAEGGTQGIRHLGECFLTELHRQSRGLPLNRRGAPDQQGHGLPYSYLFLQHLEQ